MRDTRTRSDHRRQGRLGRLVAVAVLVPLASVTLAAGTAHATAQIPPPPLPEVEPFVEIREVCVIVGADNIPKDGSHYRLDTCRLFNPGPMP